MQMDRSSFVDRFDLGKMTDRQLSQAVLGPEPEKPFSGTSIVPDEPKKHEDMPKIYRQTKSTPVLSKTTAMHSHHEKEDDGYLNRFYPESINRIISHMHEKMKRKYYFIPYLCMHIFSLDFQSLAQPVNMSAKMAEIEPPVISEPVKKQLSKKRTKKSTRKSYARSKSVLMNPNFMTLPQMKATAQTQAMQFQRRHSCVMAQERTMDIINQRRMLNEMLVEHQKLQTDRAAIALEIDAMKSYLNNIKERLDLSLRNLNIKAKEVQKRRPTK